MTRTRPPTHNTREEDMTDGFEIKVRPKIEVGQRWITASGDIARVLATDGQRLGYPVIAELEGGVLVTLTNLGCGPLQENGRSPYDFESLAPKTVKREVALYWSGYQSDKRYVSEYAANPSDSRISEPVMVEFTLLPGEGAE